MKKAEPQKEHHWLQKLVGEWTSEAEMNMNRRPKGAEAVRSLGGLWILAEVEAEHAAGPAT